MLPDAPLSILNPGDQRQNGKTMIFGRTVPFPFSCLVSITFIPLLLIGAVVSIPVTWIMRATSRRKERRFAADMRLTGRQMPWQEVRSQIESGNGTIILEIVSEKGPWRLWWTPEDVTATSPYECCFERWPVWAETDYSKFFEWCRCRFTDSERGEAFLVETLDLDRKEIHNLEKTARATRRGVSVYSPERRGA